MRLLAWPIITAALAHSTTAMGSEPLYCSVWQGIRTCQGPGGSVSHETESMGRTNGWDNQGDTWSTSRWRDMETTTIKRPER
jgi:hypothetical protein